MSGTALNVGLNKAFTFISTDVDNVTNIQETTVTIRILGQYLADAIIYQPFSTPICGEDTLVADLFPITGVAAGVCTISPFFQNDTIINCYNDTYFDFTVFDSQNGNCTGAITYSGDGAPIVVTGETICNINTLYNTAGFCITKTDNPRLTKESVTPSLYDYYFPSERYTLFN